MSSLITSHLMNGVMDSIQVQSLGSLSQIKLTCGSTVLGIYSHLQILLGGIGYDFT